jgi:hypothetical protein
MTTSLLKSALVAVAGLALCAPVALHAQATPTATPAAAPSTDSAATSTKADKVPYMGTLKSNSATSIVVTTDKGDLTLAIDPTTKVSANHKKAALTDFTVGEKVSGSYVKNDDGTMTASSVHGHLATK